MRRLINRRRFLEMNFKGMGVFAAASSISKLALGLGKTVKGEHWLDNNFPRYTDYNPDVPVWCVTPDIDRCISRFHLSSPISPSGRYVALTKLSREDRQPDPSHTPNIDEFAKQGLLFTSTYSNSAICTPNRAVLLSGLYPVKNGAHPNHSGFKPGIRSMPFCLIHAASLPHGPVLNELPNGLSGYDASNFYCDYEFGRGISNGKNGIER